MSDYQGNIIVKNPATPTGPAENGSAPGIWKLSEALAFKRQGIWPTQGVSAGDPYFSYVSMLLSTTSLGNANNNLFVDSSGAFNPISRNGNATQGSATPYSANWSVYSDNSGDYLTTGSGSSAFAFGTGNFTIEGWFYSDVSTATWKPMISVGAAAQGQLIRINQSIFTSNNWGMLYPNDAGNSDVYFDTGAAFPINQWVHVALVRNGTTLTLYQNGVNVLQKTVGFNFTNTTGVAIGYGQYPADGVFGGYMSNIRIVKGTAVYTANFTPPTTALTAISGTSLLTCQSNRFFDVSSNNFAITPVGNIRTTDFSPFSSGSPGIVYNQSDITNWSGYFDGSGDYFTVPYTTANFDWYTAGVDFTIEYWFFANSLTGTSYVDGGTTISTIVGNRSATTSTNYWSFGPNAGGTVTFYYFNGGTVGVNSTSTIAANTWNHIAMTKTSSGITIFVNGVAQTTTAISGTPQSSAGTPLTIGQGNNTSFNGYVSNLRIVRGTAIYSGNFTPPTTNLTAVSGTSLLTLQNAAFTDNSTNNFVITPNGNTTVTGNSPFNTVGYWSNYFDGSSTFSFSSISLAADFTIEAWVYYTSTSGNPTLLGENPPNNQSLRRLSGKHYFYRQGASITGTIDIPTNQWVHLATTRSGGTVRIFTNGVLDGSGSISGAFSVNCFGGVDTGTDRLTGYASNVRIVDGTALYTATFTVPTSPLTAVSGTTLLTAQNGTFKDNSTNNRTLTRNGSPTVQSFDPFYTATIASNGGSMYFDGTGDYLQTPSSPTIPFGTNDFTIEAWIYTSLASAEQNIAATRTNAGTVNGWSFAVLSNGNIRFYSNSIIVEGGAVRANSWNHVAITRNGTTVRAFVNGAIVGTGTSSENYSRDYLAVGSAQDGTQYPFTGYISNFRATKGVALYTAAFTPPTAPVTPTPATTLLVNGMNAGIYDATAINDMETVGNAQVSTVQSKFGGSSVYFDGSGDYLVAADNPTLNLGSGDFTIELWLNVPSVSSQQGIIVKRNTETTAAGTWGLRINAGGNLYFEDITNSSGIVTFGTLSTNTWTHVAVTRSGSTVRGFLNGSLISSGTSTRDFTNSFVLNIGFWGTASGVIQNALNGYIDDLRITRGVARYTATFTPPTQAFPTF